MGIAAIKVADCELISTETQVVKAIGAFFQRMKFVLLHKDVKPGDNEAIGIKLWGRLVAAMPLELSTLNGDPDNLYCRIDLHPSPLYRDGAAYGYVFCILFRQNIPNSSWELHPYFVFATHPDHFLHLTRGEQEALLKL